MASQVVRNPPAKQETWVGFLGQENPLEKEMATCSSFLPGKSYRQRSLVGYSPWGHKRVGHDWVTKSPPLWKGGWTRSELAAEQEFQTEGQGVAKSRQERWLTCVVSWGPINFSTPNPVIFFFMQQIFICFYMGGIILVNGIKQSLNRKNLSFRKENVLVNWKWLIRVKRGFIWEAYLLPIHVGEMNQERFAYTGNIQAGTWA